RTAVRGSIQQVTHEPERQDSAIHLRVSRLYRQKSRVFEPVPEGDGHWQGRVRTLLECGARLGCAPRFKDFQRMYRDAQERGLNPCEVGTD
ncbi:meteorin like, glial cell differentiation regulator, partial [Homo sapiens]